MRKTILTGLFAAVLVACAVTATTAAAHEFVTSQTKGIVQDKNIGSHVFESGLMTIECGEEKSYGVVQAKHSTVSNEEVTYGNCKAMSLPIEFSQAKYEFKAEGTMSIKGEITAKIPKEGCEIKIPTTGNENLSSVSYTSNQQSGAIVLKAAVTGITSTFSGTGAICPKGTIKTSKYKGTSEVVDYACALVGAGGHFKDPLCRQQEANGRYQLFPAIIYWH